MTPNEMPESFFAELRTQLHDLTAKPTPATEAPDERIAGSSAN